MKIIIENLIASVRILTGAFGFLLFVFIGTLVGADPHVLLLGGLLFGVLAYILGMAVANMLIQIDRETTLHPINEEEEKRGSSIDIMQDLEIPRID